MKIWVGLIAGMMSSQAFAAAVVCEEDARPRDGDFQRILISKGKADTQYHVRYTYRPGGLRDPQAPYPEAIVDELIAVDLTCLFSPKNQAIFACGSADFSERASLEALVKTWVDIDLKSKPIERSYGSAVIQIFSKELTAPKFKSLVKSYGPSKASLELSFPLENCHPLID